LRQNNKYRDQEIFYTWQNHNLTRDSFLIKKTTTDTWQNLNLTRVTCFFKEKSKKKLKIKKYKKYKKTGVDM